MIICSVWMLRCRKQSEVEKIDVLLNSEKFSKAEETARNRLSTRHSNDEYLSKEPVKDRVVQLSNDRNRAVWTEGKQIQFRDFANPLSKTIGLNETAENLSISSDAEHALISVPAANGTACRLLAVSILEKKKSYLSESFVHCRNQYGISSDGTRIYYIMDSSLYSEEVSEVKNHRVVLDKRHFPETVHSVRNRYYFRPIGHSFLIFSGDAGSYNVYWLDVRKNSLEKITDAASPLFYYGSGKNAYFIRGHIGSLNAQEIVFSAYGRPSLADSFSVSVRETVLWPVSENNEFVSLVDGKAVLWSPGGRKKELPLLAKSIYLSARDNIVYETSDGYLMKTSMEFSEEDWKALELYKKTKEKTGEK